MFLFLLFSLSVRQDNPIKKWTQWLPGNKVKAMILDRYEATGGTLPKNIIYSEEAKLSLTELQLTELEVRHALNDADVNFSHEWTKAREKPKQYYLSFEYLKKEYFAVIAVNEKYSNVLKLGIEQQ